MSASLTTVSAKLVKASSFLTVGGYSADSISEFMRSHLHFLLGLVQT